jgi:hypothetical protein
MGLTSELIKTQKEKLKGSVIKMASFASKVYVIAPFTYP